MINSLKACQEPVDNIVVTLLERYTKIVYDIIRVPEIWHPIRN